MDLPYLLNKQNYDQSLIANIAPAMSDPAFGAESSTIDPEYDMEEWAASELTPTSDSNTLVLLLSGAIANETITAIWTNPLNAAQTEERTRTQAQDKRKKWAMCSMMIFMRYLVIRLIRLATTRLNTLFKKTLLTYIVTIVFSLHLSILNI